MIRPEAPINDFKVVSKIRCQLSIRLKTDLNKIRKLLACDWNPFMEQTNTMLVDAIGYESSVRYPTDRKLLWKSVDWCYCGMRPVNPI